MSDCLFCRIAKGSVPSKKVFEDEAIFAFEDIAPRAPTHVLIVPKRVIPRLDETNESDQQLLGRLILTATKVARDLRINESGYRVVINSGPDAGESVPHLHVHLLGKRALAWPPG